MFILNENEIKQVQAGIALDASDGSGILILGVVGLIISVPIFVTMLYASYPTIPVGVSHPVTIGLVIFGTCYAASTGIISLLDQL